MLFALGAVSSAIDAFQSLTSSSKSSPATTGFSQASTASFDVTSTATDSSGTSSGTAGTMPGNGISPATMSALLAAQGQSSGTTATSMSPSDALQDLFSKIDGNGDGTISKSEFESALGAGGTNLAQADDVFGKLDANGDGSVSLDEMSSALKGAGGQGHHHAHRAGGGKQSGEDSLLQALDGASSTSTTNSDGSTTTSVTYADGSTVTLTTPAPQTSSTSASSSYNFIEQAIQREAQAISASAAQSLSVSV